MATKLRRCTEAIVDGRQNKAEQFLGVAVTVREVADSEEEVGDALVSLYVLAGIAAADVICCKALGRHAQGEDHLQAIGELSKVVPDGKQLAKDLEALLRMKTRAGYGAPAVTVDQRKRARRRAESLVEAARSR